MKTMKKVISIIMIVAMLCTSFAFSSSAAVTATAEISVAQTNSSPNVYKVTVSLQCAEALQGFDLVPVYDRTAFKVINKSGKPDSTAKVGLMAINKIGQMNDKKTYNAENPVHPVWGAIDIDSLATGEYALGAGTGDFSINHENPALGALDPAQYNALYFSYTTNTGDNALLVNYKTMSPVFTFYLQELPDAKPGDYAIDFSATKPVVNYDADGFIDSLQGGRAVEAEVVTKTATISIGKPISKSASQVTFTRDSSTANGVAAAYTYRLISKISADQMTAMTAAGKQIVKAGFVAIDHSQVGELETAKTAVQNGTALPSTAKTASTNYIYQASAGAEGNFGARLGFSSKPAEDIDCVAYVAYEDTATKAVTYVWYDAAVTAHVVSGYDVAVSTFLGA